MTAYDKDQDALSTNFHTFEDICEIAYEVIRLAELSRVDQSKGTPFGILLSAYHSIARTGRSKSDTPEASEFFHALVALSPQLVEMAEKLAKDDRFPNAEAAIEGIEDIAERAKAALDDFIVGKTCK
jgi:hypothetical protein